jgi:hypothetical protein
MQPYELIPLMGMLLTFSAIIAIVVVVSRARTRRAELQAELQSKLIEKFGSSAELVAFLQSQTGRDFVTGVQRGPGRMVRDRAAGGVRVGIFFSAIGAAFLLMWPLTENVGLAWPGVFLLILGLAFFASSYSLMRFSRTDQMQPPEPPAIQ